MKFVFEMNFLSGVENRKTFFKRIEWLFPAADHRYQLIEQAYNDSKDAFRKKYREDGDRYFEHKRAVTLILIDYLRVTDYRLIIASLLHDIVEDIPSWTIERVRGIYGDYVALLLSFLSKQPLKDFKDKAERDHAYHQRFRTAPRDFFLIKLSDRLHNTVKLGACIISKRRRKVAETKQYYLQYAEQHFILYHELVYALAQVKI